MDFVVLYIIRLECLVNRRFYKNCMLQLKFNFYQLSFFNLFLSVFEISGVLKVYIKIFTLMRDVNLRFGGNLNKMSF